MRLLVAVERICVCLSALLCSLPENLSDRSRKCKSSARSCLWSRRPPILLWPLTPVTCHVKLNNTGSGAVLFSSRTVPDELTDHASVFFRRKDFINPVPE
jgi:hypothetical protein